MLPLSNVISYLARLPHPGTEFHIDQQPEVRELPHRCELLDENNINEVITKKKQRCDEIFLSPVFQTNKSKKYLNISKFNLIALNCKMDCIESKPGKLI